MPRNHLALRLLSSAIAGLLLVMAPAGTSRGECLPRRGEFEGVYHRDRWGVGHFAFYLVAPELHDQLAGFENRRVRLEVLEAFQFSNPGDAIIRKIGKIAELEESQIQPELATRIVGRSDKTQNVELTFFLVNRSDKAVQLSLQDFHVGIRTARQVDRHDERSWTFPEYTNGQLRPKGHDSSSSFNNHLTMSSGSFEHGHHLRIGAGQRFPVVLHYQLESGQHEISLSGRPFVDKNRDVEVPPFAKWFSFDLKAVTPDGEKPHRTELRLADVQWASAQNQWQKPCVRLSFVVKAPTGKQRSLATCSESDRNPLAGRLTTKTVDGADVPVAVDPCYDCSNLGEAWELVPIPEKGISTSLNISLGRESKPFTGAKRVRLQLLTDRGLESFELDVPALNSLVPAK